LPPGSLSFCCAWFAAGVLTAFPVDAAPCAALGAVVVAPRLLPVVPWLRAFEVLGPGPPPVPLRVLPFERVLPVEPVELPMAVPALAPAEPPPAAPPALCARATDCCLAKCQSLMKLFSSLSLRAVGLRHLSNSYRSASFLGYSFARNIYGCWAVEPKQPRRFHEDNSHAARNDPHARNSIGC
jgi:hypothetical protein